MGGPECRTIQQGCASYHWKGFQPPDSEIALVFLNLWASLGLDFSLAAHLGEGSLGVYGSLKMDRSGSRCKEDERTNWLLGRASTGVSKVICWLASNTSMTTTVDQSDVTRDSSESGGDPEQDLLFPPGRAHLRVG
ncbi:conserved hypothetical protein [Coccidioides posadasii str. Silveira]|uniref:Uncharacterized protein n=3 Tax=Coccidioides posadasii TaxID=199306 RepID=E9DBZ2_COCPS|nr:conserved hypothetical protein [Coccidioides posadasii str. Silveira]KMM67809.1 hypothetical protein CPAG_04142 [Coccidioides posadasii RMSCC 3488]